MTVDGAGFRRLGRSAAFWLGLAVLFVQSGPAQAQLLDNLITPNVVGTGIDPGVTVLSRSRPEFDNGGIRAGSFIIRPQLTQSVGYESNVLGLPKGVGSALAETAASLSTFSNWSRNSLGASLSVDNYKYFDQPHQSYTNWTASLAGTVDVGRDQLAMQYQHLHLNQTSRDLDTPNLAQPLGYDVDTAIATYRVNLNRLSIVPGITVANYAYSNGMVGGAEYEQTYRNRVVTIPSLTFNYEFSPRRSAIVVVRNGTGSYTDQVPGQPSRDYNNPAVLGGLDYDVTGLFRIRLLVGYEERLFSSSSYKTIRSPVVEATAVWTPTGLTTVTGTFSRHTSDTADEAVAAYTETDVLLAIDHEYLRNVLLRGTGGLQIGDYSGGSQTVYSAGAGATYLANRYARLSATYDVTSRATSGTIPLGINGTFAGGGYTDHRFLLQLRLAL